MESVFISSVQSGFEDVRTAARLAVESLDMRPLMAETTGASAASPQRALLDLVARADVFLLIVGSRYSKPTEDEFDEARRLSKEIFVLRQEGDCEPEQREFVARVAGGWKGGRLWGGFADANDVGFGVVRALVSRRGATDTAELGSQARSLAYELASGSVASGASTSPIARTAHAPLVPGVLLDAVRLEHPDLGEKVASLAREHRLVAQSVGLETKITREGITLCETGSYARAALVEVRADGAVTSSSEVAGSDHFGSSRVDPDRLDTAIRTAGAFARSIWELIDDREQVQQVAVAVAIPNAQYKVFGASTGSNTLSTGSHGLPQTVLVPEPPLVVRRAEVGSVELVQRLVAEIRRVFTDAGAIER